ncbi:MAG: potassium-transporting ATPase subunit KdpA, partial [Desulfobacteraceae bacterium]
MDIFGWVQLLIFVLALALLTKPMGLYLARVLDSRGRTGLEPVLKPMERIFYRLLRIDPDQEQDWKQFGFSLLLFSLVGLLFAYAILRLQHLLPLNPQGFGPVPADLAFNTAASFATNTNWQNYAGEATLSYFSQMVGLVFHNFVSAATGLAVAAALVRGIARASAKTIGNFWVDLVRLNLYLLLPLSLVFALVLVTQGVIQNFKAYDRARLLEPYRVMVPQKDNAGREQTDRPGKAGMTEREQETQTIAQGPVASQVAIKMLGTNGGGFFNANAAHPFENPTPLSNFLQILAIFLIPSGLTYYLGRTVRNQRHGWTIWAVMLILFLAGMIICW